MHMIPYYTPAIIPSPLNRARVCAGYGVQKNVANTSGLVSGVSTSQFSQTLPAFFSPLSGNNQLLSFLWRSASRSQMDETYKREQKFLIADKENVSAKRDTETLLLAKDSGKHFSRGLHLGGGRLSHAALFWTTFFLF